MNKEELLEMKRTEVQGWFQKVPLADIQEGNFKEWLGWVCYVQRYPSLTAQERQVCDRIYQEVEEWLEIRFSPGINMKISEHMLTTHLNPLRVYAFPAIFYFSIQIVLAKFQDMQLKYLNFGKHACGSLTYWYRPGHGLPLVVCHGLGINLLPYLIFVRTLLANGFEGRPIFLLSFTHISMHVDERVPSSAETVACIKDLLDRWDFKGAHFIGHSFGTVVLAWMLRRARERVHCCTFIDPIVFLLYKPTLMYNFFYRAPVNPTQQLIRDFIARELFTCHSIQRSWFWHESFLEFRDLRDLYTVVVLSAQDCLIPVDAIRRSLELYKMRFSIDSELIWLESKKYGWEHAELNFGSPGARGWALVVDRMRSMELAAENRAPFRMSLRFDPIGGDVCYVT
jgi:pimeloyl-ACP methyl ester carboxylesterase